MTALGVALFAAAVILAAVLDAANSRKKSGASREFTGEELRRILHKIDEED